MTHNAENLLIVADAIEKHTLDLGFNMAAALESKWLPDLSGHNCGTTCCIAGWAEHIFKDSAESSFILEPQEQSLFMPDGWMTYPERYTVARSVAVLRHAALTGEVRWDLFDEAGF